MNPSPPAPPPTPDPRETPAARGSAGWHIALVRGFARARAFHAAVRFLWSLMLVLGFLVLYLWIVGVPSFLVREGLRRIEAASFPIDVRRVRLAPPRDVVAEGVRVGSPLSANVDLCRAGRITFEVDWVDLLRGRASLRDLTLQDGELLLPPTGAAATPEHPHSLVLTGICAHVQITNTEVRIDDLTAALGGLQLRGGGRLLRAARPAEPATNFLADLHGLLLRFETAPAWISRFLQEARSVRYGQSSQAQLTFQVHPAMPDWNRIELSAEGGTAEYEGLDVDRWNLRAALVGHRLTLEEAVLMAATNSCRLACAVDLTNRTFEGSVVNSIPPDDWPRVFPGRWQPWLQRHVAIRGGFKSEAWTPVVPLAEIGSRAAGWFSFDDATLAKVDVPRGFVSFKRNGAVLDVERSRLTFDHGTTTGSADFAFAWDTTGGVFRGRSDFIAFPSGLAPWLSSNQNGFAARLAYSNGPPRLTAEFSGRVGDPGAFHLNGLLRSSNTSYRGVYAHWIETGIAFSNHTLTLDPFAFMRDEGEVAGAMVFDFTNKLYRVDLDGVIEPLAAARMVGPGLQRALRVARAERPALMRVHGAYDGSPAGRTDLDVEIQGNRIGFGRFVADRCSFLLHVGNDDYVTTNVVGTLHGGPFAGTIHIFKQPSATTFSYEITATATNVDLLELVQAVTTRTNHPPTPGRLSFWTDVHGLLGDGFGYTARGTGALQVREGHLFAMPVLGGLSKYLSRIYPGLGFASQTDFTASVNIASGRVYTANGMLEGNVISVKCRGDHYFDQRLDFVVEVQPLRDGVVAAAVRVITLPLTKLLQFHLGGTLDKPDWRPENLPKELFLDFD